MERRPEAALLSEEERERIINECAQNVMILSEQLRWKKAAAALYCAVQYESELTYNKLNHKTNPHLSKLQAFSKEIEKDIKKLNKTSELLYRHIEQLNESLAYFRIEDKFNNDIDDEFFLRIKDVIEIAIGSHIDGREYKSENGVFIMRQSYGEKLMKAEQRERYRISNPIKGKTKA